MIVDRAQIATALPGYTLGDEIGAGSFGLVIAGWHRRLQRDVAIKVVAAGRRSRGQAEPVAAEGRILASLDHPHVVRVYDHVDCGDLHLIVMEMLAGGTLTRRMPRLGQQEACAVGLAVADALSAAHARGVLHRDIKPDNVLFDGAGLPKVVDFGIAKLIRGSAATASQVFGTPMFMAPEQFVAGRLGPYTDLYALGVMLYLQMAGHAPFEGPADPPLPRQYRDRHLLGDRPSPPVDVPRTVANVILGALDRNPARRPPSARAFALDLAKAAADAYGPRWLAGTGITVRLDDEVRAAAERSGAGAGVALGVFTVPARADTAVLAAGPTMANRDGATLDRDWGPQTQESTTSSTVGPPARTALSDGADGRPPADGGSRGRRGGRHGRPGTSWRRPRHSHQYVAAAVALLVAATVGSVLATRDGRDSTGAHACVLPPNRPPTAGATVTPATATEASSPPPVEEISARPLGQPVRTGSEWATSAILSPAGPTLIAGNRDGSLRQWNIEHPSDPRAVGEPLTIDGLGGAVLSPDGRTLAAGSRSPMPSLRLWDASVAGVLQPLSTVPAHTNSVISVAFQPSGGKLLATGSWDKTVQLWDVSDRSAPRRVGAPLTGHSDWVFQVVFSSDGRLLASASRDGTVRLWDVSDPKAARAVGEPLAGHRAGADTVAFAPGSPLLASGATDGTLRLWNVSDPANICPLSLPITGHNDRIWNVQFAPGGDVLASASADGTVRLWDVRDPSNPRQIGEPLGHPDVAMAVAFSSDSRLLATTSWDGTVRLWSLTSNSGPTD